MFWSHEDGGLLARNCDPPAPTREELKARATRETRATSQTERSGVFRFSDLPAELRLQVCQHLIPTGHIYNIVPMNQRRQKWVAVNKIILATSSVLHADTAILRVSRRFQHELYDMLYGGNKFIINVTNGNLYGAIHSNDYSTFSSWSKPHTEDPRPFWPFPHQTAKYLKHLRVNVRPSSRNAPVDHRQLQTRLDKIVDMLSTDHCLKSLEVTLGEQRHSTFQRYDASLDASGALILHEPYSAASPSPADQRYQYIMAPRTGTPYDRESETPPIDTSHQYILEPLARLHNIPSVTINGAVSPVFAAQLISIMTAPEPVALELLPPVAAEFSLRRRSGRKRRSMQSRSHYKRPKLAWQGLDEAEVRKS
ncbi:hypothetical protein LTR66_004935 [Elasticomyces elasticus]|nr:hypothetical protein LTR66_004935 [Elasticomyces elasticus]KAK5007102.1 hypothetical protein LTR28_005682 [Elasticomyces elasticus]